MKTYKCADISGGRCDIKSFSPREAAESYAEECARDGLEPDYVRVVDPDGRAHYFEVSVEMDPSAHAAPCDGGGLDFSEADGVT